MANPKFQFSFEPKVFSLIFAVIGIVLAAGFSWGALSSGIQDNADDIANLSEAQHAIGEIKETIAVLKSQQSNVEKDVSRILNILESR